MDSEVIRSFLVSVGVQVDEKGLKRFGQTVENITKTTAAFAEALGAAAVAASAAVIKVASEFDDLYYASQRLRSSVDNIKAFSFGVSQMGGNAQAARQSLESFASFMRSNPMGEGVLRGLGVATRDEVGNAREYADVLRDTGEQLRKMPYWAAKIRANMLGIDENTLQAMIRGTDLWSDRYRKMVRESGVDMDQMASDATDLMQSLRLLRAEIELRLYAVIKAINPEILKFAALIGAAGAAVALLSIPLVGLVAGILAVGTAIVLLTDDYNGWKNGADSLINWAEWSGEIDAFLGATVRLFAAFGDLGSALAGLAGAFNKVFGDDVQKIFRAFINTMIDGIDELRIAVEAVGMLLRGDLKGAAGKAREFAAVGARDVMRDRSPASKPNPPATNDNAPAGRSATDQAMSYFMKQGWTREQARGLVAGMVAESRMNPTAVNPTSGAAGIGQWLGPRKRTFESTYGKKIQDATLAEQLQFMQWELMGGDYAGKKVRAQTTATGVLNSYIKDFMRPAAGAETTGDISRGTNYLNSQRLGGNGGNGATVTINSQTDIKLTGGDAREAARVLGPVIDDRNSRLIRNTQAAVK